jgi:hypothetical protein
MSTIADPRALNPEEIIFSPLSDLDFAPEGEMASSSSLKDVFIADLNAWESFRWILSLCYSLKHCKLPSIAAVRVLHTGSSGTMISCQTRLAWVMSS